MSDTVVVTNKGLGIVTNRLKGQNLSMSTGE